MIDIALCFPDIASYRARPPIRTAIALAFVSYNALQSLLGGGVSKIKLPSEGYRAIGGGGLREGPSDCNGWKGETFQRAVGARPTLGDSRA